jgi:hypothetical protein
MGVGCSQPSPYVICTDSGSSCCSFCKLQVLLAAVFDLLVSQCDHLR